MKPFSEMKDKLIVGNLYYIEMADRNDKTLVKYWYRVATRCYGFSFFSSDGGVFLPVSDILDGTLITELTITEKEEPFTYFGKDCTWFTGQWHRDTHPDCPPEICFCKHSGNPEEKEGNCYKEICPMKREK